MPPNYGNRTDGTPKGLGYFGELKRPDGNVSTELSIGVNLGGKEMEIPLLVPTLSRPEIDSLLAGGKPSPEMVDKAVQFAIERMDRGMSPFAGDGEQTDLPGTPAEVQGAFDEGFTGKPVGSVVNGAMRR